MEEGLSYCASLQKPTAVTGAVVGHFRNSNELDIMIARVSRVEHLLFTADGLKPHREIPIFGRIASINSFKLPGEELNSLLVLTAKYHLAILGFAEDGQPRTRAFGHVADKVGRPAETGIITCVHESGLIALRLYEGHLKLIQWQDGRDLKNFNVRFEDYNVTDVAFLENTEEPTIAYFYQDLNGRHLKVCEVDLEVKELRAPLWHQSNIEAEATLLVPVPAPYGGLIVVGQESISYQKSPSHYTAIAPPLIHMARFNCCGRIDRTGERFLLGDMSGRLFMLVLLRDPAKEDDIRDIKIELLGEISIPECIVYLDNSVAFVGSRLGDSQLIRLSTEPVDLDSNSFVNVISTFSNLGPIRDLILMDVDGQTQIVCASGAFKEGSLRIIRSGIGIDEKATVELAGIKGLFPLRIGDEEFDNYLVVSFADVTHLLLIDSEDLEDTQIPDFDLTKRTLWAGNLTSFSNRLLQITSDHVQMLSGDGTFHAKWMPEPPCRISLASVNQAGSQLLLSSGPRLFYLHIESDKIVLLHRVECANEVACLDISPLGNRTLSDFFTVGFWSEHSVAVYALKPGTVPSLVAEERLTSEFVPRSMLMVTMESVDFLFVALGDGTVVHFRMDPLTGVLSAQKKFALGTQPTLLRVFQSAKKTALNVFACSDRPTVIYSSNHKLSFSNVNLRSVAQMCSLNSDCYRDCLALADGENLIIGTIDEIQKLHIRTVQLGETVHRLAYQPESNLIAILTTRCDDFFVFNRSNCRPSISIIGAKTSSGSSKQTFSASFTAPSTGGEGSSSQAQNSSSSCDHFGGPGPSSTGTSDGGETHSICFLDANTFERVHVIELNKQETGLSITSAHLGEDPHPYFAIGTANVIHEESESKQGRIMVLQASQDDEGNNTKIRSVTEKEVKGAAFSITTLGNKLICTVNSTVRLFEWTAERELRLECSNFNNIQALFLKTKGDLVLVADLMRSISVLGYKAVDSTFEEFARDYSTEWTSACEIVDSETFLAAENHHNIYCCRIDVNAETDEDRARLKQVGLYYLGEMVNVFRRGSIVSAQQRERDWVGRAGVVDDVTLKFVESADERGRGETTTTLFSNPITYGTSDGGLGVIVQVPLHIYAFLRELQKAITTKTHNCLRVDHPVYRSFFTERRVEPPIGFIDGDLVETVTEMPREMLEGIVDGLRLWKEPDAMEEETVLARPEDVLKLVEDLTQIR
uniref:DNA damage-binding protein 1 n=1 Tax=Globodera rostochiensis TaxID=31243 RepID=A0A914HG40_GLORO